ncbi:MAG: hypothetical protein ABL997_14500, partial [Planctomycetota bacterium]
NGTLNRLGVNTTADRRQAAPGLAVADDYAPLGTSPALSKTNELLLFEIGLNTPVSTDPAIVLELTDANGNATAQVLHGVNRSALPTTAESPGSNSVYQSLRVPLAADIDGDGLDETVVVYQRGVETRVHVVDDATAGFAARDLQIATNSGVTGVTAAAGDLDGDGDDDLVVGFTQQGDGVVRVFRSDATAFAEIATVHRFGPRLAGAQLYLAVAVGNLDLDRSLEFAVAITEATTTTGSSRYAVCDDLGSGLLKLREADFTGRDQSNFLQVGITASVAIGDVDGDTIGEVLLGGVTAFTRFCDATPYFLLAVDDAAHGLQDLAGRSFQHFVSGCDSPADRRIRTVHLHTLDLDDDGRVEVLANQFVFQNFSLSAPWTENTSWRLPDTVMWTQGHYGWFDRSTTSFVVGDFTGDDRADVACYRQDVGFVDVYALAATATAIQRVRHVAVPFANSQSPKNPVLVPINVDTDSIVLKYSDAEYQLVFSEPIVLAALAAPPTRTGIGQNVAASFTAFGNTQTTLSERERSLTFSAGVTVGVNLDGGALTQSEFSLKGTATIAATRSQGSAYELSKTIVFTTAPTEDTIVFTSVPIDRYTYTVTSHPDPAMVGERVIVDFPRSPVTLQAERGFYNESILDADKRIDDLVFGHQVGDARTYPTAAAKNALLGSGGLEIGPQAVGQGGGSTEVTLQVGTSVSRGGELEVGFELELEVTGGGLVGGLTLGVDASSSWRVTSGTSTTYTGVVGAIDAANFAANRYSFGLFTYVHRDPRTTRQFQVLNYWIE